jgi:hypothetical protein
VAHDADVARLACHPDGSRQGVSLRRRSDSGAADEREMGSAGQGGAQKKLPFPRAASSTSSGSNAYLKPAQRDLRSRRQADGLAHMVGMDF